MDKLHVYLDWLNVMSYDIKAAYVKANHLGGMMFWELSQDHDDELLDVIMGSLRK